MTRRVDIQPIHGSQPIGYFDLDVPTPITVSPPRHHGHPVATVLTLGVAAGLVALLFKSGAARWLFLLVACVFGLWFCSAWQDAERSDNLSRRMEHDRAALVPPPMPLPADTPAVQVRRAQPVSTPIPVRRAQLVRIPKHH